MIPPTLPAKTEIKNAYWLPQNWRGQDRYWFHHATQGTATFPMPYDWFVALEQPGLPWTVFGARKNFPDERLSAAFRFHSEPARIQRTGSANTAFKSDSDERASGVIGSMFLRRIIRRIHNRLPVGFARLSDRQAGPDRLGFDLRGLPHRPS